MHQSQINIQVTLDDDKMPEQLQWQAPDGGIEELQDTKAVMLGVWDGQEKHALRIDLWTKKMMVDEMNDFIFQSFMGMAETYNRATRNGELAKEIQDFARGFYKKAMDALEAAEQKK